MNPGSSIFLDHRRPRLASGSSTIELTQTIGAGATSESGKPPCAFSVLGPRYGLSAHDVHGVDPPPESLGDQEGKLTGRA